MLYVEAPYTNYVDLPKPLVFLAGGITGCPDWQADVRHQLQDFNAGTLLNPRRKNFPIHDPMAAKGQITWEFNALTAADIILFWFPKETLCPIVLYELGRWAASSKPLIVGVDPMYQRKQDVEIQMELARPKLSIYYSLEDIVNQIKKTV